LLRSFQGVTPLCADIENAEGVEGVERGPDYSLARQLGERRELPSGDRRRSPGGKRNVSAFQPSHRIMPIVEMFVVN